MKLLIEHTSDSITIVKNLEKNKVTQILTSFRNALSANRSFVVDLEDNREIHINPNHIIMISVVSEEE